MTKDEVAGNLPNLLILDMSKCTGEVNDNNAKLFSVKDFEVKSERVTVEQVTEYKAEGLLEPAKSIIVDSQTLGMLLWSKHLDHF